MYSYIQKETGIYRGVNLQELTIIKGKTPSNGTGLIIFTIQRRQLMIISKIKAMQLFSACKTWLHNPLLSLK